MPTNSLDWIRKTHRLSDLRAKADEFDAEVRSMGNFPNSEMLSFLRYAGVLPAEMKWSRRNSLPRTSLNVDAIPAGYLAEVAYEWDDDGFSTANEFVDMLEFECTGTIKNDVLSETLTELGRQA